MCFDGHVNQSSKSSLILFFYDFSHSSSTIEHSLQCYHFDEYNINMYNIGPSDEPELERKEYSSKEK